MKEIASTTIFFRYAAVKGFEISLETAGKLLRKAIKPYFATSKEVDRLIFKDVFRYAGKHDLLTTGEIERWFEYRGNHNNTAHDYGKDFAEKTLVLLARFIEDTKQLIKVINNAKS
ncbi:MAG: nucleotidyltransferase substrate binding protein [Gammaproteobacteria bacterium]|nr:nucleotidyltransferase substrate binding protein [Gammaproteobacteria bacterium]